MVWTLRLGSLIAFFYSCILVFKRAIDADEGFYLAAAEQVALGRTPYIDFFYPQASLLPYLYGAFGAVAGFSWPISRFPSLIFLLLAVICLRRAAYSLTKGHSTAIETATFVFCASPLVYSWGPTAKTYGFTLFVLALFVALLERGGRWAQFLAGLSLGIGVSARLLVVGAAAGSVPGLMRLSMLRFFSGALIGILPILAGLLWNPELFLFNNFGFHARRAELPPEAISHLRVDLLLWFTGGRTFDNATLDGVCLASLFIVGFVSACSNFRVLKLPILRLTGMVFGLGVCAFVPVPPMTQYVTVLVVPVALAVSLGVAARPTSVVTVIASVVLTLLPSFSADRHTCLWGSTSCSDPFVPRLAVLEVSTIADRVRTCGEGRKVISLWPGYLLGQGTRVWPGTENHFGIAASEWLSNDQRGLYRLAGEKELIAAVLDRSADCVVFPELRVRQLEEFRMTVRDRCRIIFDRPSATIFSCG